MKLALIILAVLALHQVTGQDDQVKDQWLRLFTNPIFEGNSADPAVLFHNGYYYLTLSTDGERSLTIYKSRRLTNFRDAEKKVIYRCPEGNFNLWASELHFIRGDLYIYFCMDGNAPHHKMYVMKADDPSDPMGTWQEPIRMMPNFPERAIDGTVLQHGNGQLYFVFSSEGQTPLSLFIAEMDDPISVRDSVMYLRGPQSSWEGGPRGVNEAPYFLYNNGVSYLVFSADSTWTPAYCLGLMSIPGDKDPMNPSNWNYGEDHCVFEKNEFENVYTTGHASFTTSPDGKETWMTYHGCDNTTHINGYRIARVEKITWNEDGSPKFPKAHGRYHPQIWPSGQV